MTRTVQAYKTINANIRRPVDADIDGPDDGLAGNVTASAAGYVSAEEMGDGAFHQTILTLADLPQAIADATSWKGTQIYDFPKGRLHVLGCVARLAPKTTTAIATTIKSGVAGAVGLGTTAASKIAIDTTMVDLLPSTVTANSTVINVAAAFVNAVLAAAAVFDGTSTPKVMFLNSSVAAIDIDADGALAWSGKIRITWANLGDFT